MLGCYLTNGMSKAVNRPPAFQFFPKDFISDINVMAMTLEQRGAYITLLSHCWIEGSLPDDPRVLQALCNHPSNWDEVWFALEPCFKRSEGRLINPRLEVERKKQEEWRKKSAAGGRKSGVSRREKPKEGSLKGGSRVGQPNANQMRTKREPNGNSSSSSSSSSSLKKKVCKGNPATEVPATYIELSRSFLEQQRKQIPKESAWKDFEARVAEGAKNLHLFHTQNSWIEDEIRYLLDWVAEDDFWSEQIRTLGSIRARKKGKGTPMKFENAMAAMRGEKGGFASGELTYDQVQQIMLEENIPMEGHFKRREDGVWLRL